MTRQERILSPSVTALLPVFLALVGQAQAPQAPPQLAEIDLERIAALYRLGDALGAELWPGFELRKIPIAVNNQDREEILIAHPKPPEEFQPWEDHSVDGAVVLRREGSTRYGPRGGGWAVDLIGVQCAYVGAEEEGLATESYPLLILHECFHVFQDHRARAAVPMEEPPRDDPSYSALLALESRTLNAGLCESEEEQARTLCRMFLAVRGERRRALSPAVLAAEGESEYSEGSATYVSARAVQWLAAKGGLEKLLEDADYHGFADAAKRYAEHVQQVLPPPGERVEFFHAMYNHGMAQGLLLDRSRPDWKQEMAARGSTQTGLLEQTFADSEEERAGLLAQAKERFHFDVLLAEQTQAVADWLAVVRGYLEAPGRRYRVLHGLIPGPFNWKPEGPVYPYKETTIWAGGIRRFDRGPLVFESGNVPVIFTHAALEWIDPDPDPDGRDLKIASASVADGLYRELVLDTDGFHLSVPLARIEITEDLVTIRPVSE